MKVPEYKLTKSRDDLLEILPKWMTASSCYRWLLWKGPKIPFYANGKTRAGGIALDSPEDLVQLVSFDEVYDVFEKGGYTGIGFALGPDGNGGYWQGIDLDHLDINHGLNDIPLLGYSELSPSGKGRHMFGYGREFHVLGSNKSGIETYPKARYFTVTGNGGILLGYKTPENPVCLANYVEQTLQPLHSQHSKKKAQSSTRKSPATEPKEITQPHPQTMTYLRDALFSMPADDRELWIAMGQALRWIEGGFELWAEWSGTSVKFKGEIDLGLWSSFGGDRTGYAAVFARAQQDGWVNPARKYEKADIIFGNQAGTPLAESNTGDEGQRSLKIAGSSTHVNQSSQQSSAQSKIIVHPFAECRSRKKLQWLIKKVIPEGSLGSIYGASGSGKSFLTIGMGLAIASGKLWCGHKVKQGRVIYIAAEGGGGLGMRLEAYAFHHNISDNTLAFDCILEPQNLFETNEKNLNQLVEAFLADGPISLIIFDTLACSSVGADENSVKDMGIVIDNCKEIIKRTGATVLLVHHEGKDPGRGARGSSVLKASFDFEINITAASKITPKELTMKITKLKDGENDKNYKFRLQPISLGTDEDGEPIFSCVALVDDSCLASVTKNNPFHDERQIHLVLSFIRGYEDEISTNSQASNNLYKILASKQAISALLGDRRRPEQYKEEVKRILALAKTRHFIEEITSSKSRNKSTVWKITEMGHQYMNDYLPLAPHTSTGE